ncbi:MAG: zinc ribbon domain-containing protein [Armatimonadetes bacterium]|nr:zinc ribbon domain-containing protein [Armatimonadota bacterium]
MTDLILQPGDLAALLTAQRLEVCAESPLAGSPLLAASATARPLAEGAELPGALQTLALPSLVIAGLRGARRMEPWPFFICRRSGGPAVLLAPEGGGSARLRFPCSEEDLVDWLARSFRRFAAPEIACAEVPPLTPTGLAVILAMMDIFRSRYPDLDPDWKEMEPITFTSEEVVATVAAAGSEPSALMSGLARLGGPEPETLSLETVESLLYVFSNEGYLEMELSTSPPLFTVTESFVGTLLSLAWWDMSLSLESKSGSSGEPIQVIQGLALWRFITGSDRRTRMQALSGTELEAEIRTLLSPGGESQAALSPSFCPDCGKPMPPAAKFCGDCGVKVALQGCRKCGWPGRPGARFCPECGEPV